MATMTLNALMMPNVSLGNKAANLYGGDKSKFTMYSKELGAVLWELVTKHPGWEFVVLETRAKFDGVPMVRVVQVKEGASVLGEIGVEFSSRHNGDALYVHNERIGAARSRNRDRNKQFSKDPKKILSTVKKTFAPKSPAEIMGEAYDKAYDIVTNIVSDTQYKSRSVIRDVQEQALTYALNEIRANFLGYLQQDPVGNKIAIAAMGHIDTVKANMHTAQQVRERMRNRAATLVVVDGDEYLIKSGEEVKVFASDTLPDYLKLPMGMLKLVEDTQMIENMGYRVDSTTFVITAEAPVAEQPQE